MWNIVWEFIILNQGIVSPKEDYKDYIHRVDEREGGKGKGDMEKVLGILWKWTYTPWNSKPMLY